MCYEAPKHGNDIPEMNKLVRRVYNSIYQAFQNVGVEITWARTFKSAPDAYTKSIHNLMGLVTGALPTGKKAGVALTDGSLSAMPGTDINGPTALVMSAAKGMDSIKYTATHMNMKLPPDQLKTRKGRENVLNLVKTYMDLDGGHIQFNVLDTNTLRDAQKHPEKYRDLVVRVAGFSAFFTKLHPACRTRSSHAPSRNLACANILGNRYGVALSRRTGIRMTLQEGRTSYDKKKRNIGS